jgi:hypothetical protein
MLNSISNIEVEEDVTLARIMLSWAMYARTPITIEELFGPYSAELKSMIDIKHAVYEVCGGFVILDANNRITLVHHSAKEYLVRNRTRCANLSLDPMEVHEALFGKCLVAICDKTLRSRLRALRVSQFFQYAATSWSFHLDNCSAHSDRIYGLTRFFEGGFTLSWVQYLAMSGHLSDLPRVARKLVVYARKRRNIDAKRAPSSQDLSAIKVIEDWAIDLENIAVKFGPNLSEDPSMIYKCVPALSPSSSAIFQSFSGKPTTILSVRGTLNKKWDDCIARVSVSSGRAFRLACSSLYLAVAVENPRGDIILWDTTLFQEFRTLSMKQRVSEFVFNHSGSLFACCGISRTCVWRVKDGTAGLTAQNPPQERAMELKFDENDSLFMVTDIRGVYRLSYEDGEPEKGDWVRLSPKLLEETALPAGVWIELQQGLPLMKTAVR